MTTTCISLCITSMGVKKCFSKERTYKDILVLSDTGHCKDLCGSIIRSCWRTSPPFFLGPSTSQVGHRDAVERIINQGKIAL